MIISLASSQMNHRLLVLDCVFFSVCYKPSSALVQAQPLEGSLII